MKLGKFKAKVIDFTGASIISLTIEAESEVSVKQNGWATLNLTEMKYYMNIQSGSKTAKLEIPKSVCDEFINMCYVDEGKNA